jgi:hypothetical protein
MVSGGEEVDRTGSNWKEIVTIRASELIDILNRLPYIRLLITWDRLTGSLVLEKATVAQALMDLTAFYSTTKVYYVFIRATAGPRHYSD